MIKLAFPLRRREDMSREEFQRYWREEHAPLVATKQELLGIRRYVQLHTRATDLDATLAEERGNLEPFDGIAELWWDSVEDLAATFDTPEGQAAWKELLEDEWNFIDLRSSPIWLGEENVVIG